MKYFSKITRFPRPEDGLRAMVECAPQAEAFAATWIERVRPLAIRFYTLRRRIATIAVTLLAASLFLHVTSRGCLQTAELSRRPLHSPLQKT